MPEIDPRRVKKLNKSEYENGPILYWMSREQRVHGNWSLLTAQASAIKHKVPLLVLFCLQDKFLGATNRQYDFMLEGLSQVKVELRKLNIDFVIRKGPPEVTIVKLIDKQKIGGIITDYSPLKISKKWLEEVIKQLNIPVWQVDSHSIVPVWVTSEKQEYAARTIRPKINKHLADFLVEYPRVKKHPFKFNKQIKSDLVNKILVESIVAPVSSIKSGEKYGKRMLRDFINNRLKYYSEYRNNPLKEAISNLSPYLHFGQISAQSVALEVRQSKYKKDVEAFLEELIVRKELAENFCEYNKNYDSFEGFPDWAQKTLNSHKSDKREFVYNLRIFENAETHDDVWNGAQIELLTKGKMHGYMRMYWAKKILEWTETPEEALEIAIKLNDKYQLDGRDPNGYTGIAWSIGGVHDRPWFTRPVYGNVRYMNRNGLDKKFDTDEYIRKFIK